MKVIQRIVGFFFFTVILCMSVMMFWASLLESRWSEFTGLFAASRVSGIFVSVSMVCLAGVYAVAALSPKRRSRYLSFDKDGGTVSISTEAIAEYIAKLGTEFPSVMKMKPTVMPFKNTVDILVDIHVKAGPQIHEVCELLQHRVRESMTNGLGISEVRNVEVSVAEIVSEHRPG